MFCTPLRLEATRPGRWVLLSDLIWDGAEHIVVPAGFDTDLASVPWVLRWLLNVNGASRRPAVLHDWLYNRQAMPRRRADAVFRQALKADEVILPGRWMYWGGVRIGGWVAWSNKGDLATPTPS